MSGGRQPAGARIGANAGQRPLPVVVDVEVDAHYLADRSLGPVPGTGPDRVDAEEQVVPLRVKVAQPRLRALGRQDLAERITCNTSPLPSRRGMATSATRSRGLNRERM